MESSVLVGTAIKSTETSNWDETRTECVNFNPYLRCTYTCIYMALPRNIKEKMSTGYRVVCIRGHQNLWCHVKKEPMRTEFKWDSLDLIGHFSWILWLWTNGKSTIQKITRWPSDSTFLTDNIMWKTSNHILVNKKKTLAANYWLIFTWDSHRIIY